MSLLKKMRSIALEIWFLKTGENKVLLTHFIYTYIENTVKCVNFNGIIKANILIGYKDQNRSTF